MTQVITAIVALTMTVGTLMSGQDLMDMMIRLAQVTTERFTLSQIGKSVVMNNAANGGVKLEYRKFHSFIRKNITAGGRDTSKDIWGTFYYLENKTYWKYVFPPRGDEFVVVSAGPDKEWWTADDESWMNFVFPDEFEKYRPKSTADTSSASAVMDKLNQFREEHAEKLNKIKEMLGMDDEGEEEERGDPPT